MTPLQWFAVVLLAGGVFFTAVSAVGVLRLPDLYTRAHATSKADTLGTLLMLLGVAVVVDGVSARVKIVLLLLFVFVTSPTAAHAITRAAYDQGIEPWTRGEAEE